MWFLSIYYIPISFIFENDANRSKIKTTDAQHNFLERSNLINPLCNFDYETSTFRSIPGPLSHDMKIKSRIGHIFNAKRKITMFGFDETSFYFVEKGIPKIVPKDRSLHC